MNLRTHELNKLTKGGVKTMAIKKSVWDIILKVIIAAVSALAGAVGAHAMPM